MSMSRHFTDVYVMPSMPQGFSADQEAARHKRLYDQRAGVAELCPGDKVLVKLDGYQGACWKLVNWWSSSLHTVVRRVADDVPAYVIENAKGDRKVLTGCGSFCGHPVTKIRKVYR